MCKSSRGDSDRPDVRDASSDATNQCMVDMSNPSEARSFSDWRGEKKTDRNTDELNFDNPYGDDESQSWSSGESSSGNDYDAVDQTTYPTGDQTDYQVVDQTDFQPRNQASISELTARSEAQLPRHANGSYPDPEHWEDLHAKMVQRAQQAAQNGTDLVFYGDSITEAMGYNPEALGAFQKNFGQENPTPLAIGGDGTNQLLYRVNHGELQGEPKVAVVMIGSNDIGGLSTEQIKDNTSAIIDSIQARSPNTKVLLMGILPRPLAGDPGNVRVDETNSALSQLATTDGAVQFANINNNFIDSNGNEISSLYQQDGLHLSNAGYRVWANAINDQLAELLNSPDVPRNYPPENEIPEDEVPQYYPPTYDDPHYDPQYEYPQYEQPQYEQPQYDAPQGDSEDGYSPVSLPRPVHSPASSGDTLAAGSMHGANLDGAEWQKWRANENEFWPTAKYLDYAKSKGMNTVRLPISWEQFQPKLNGPLDQNEMNQLHIFLEAAEARGIKVILSLQNFDRYNLNHGPQGQGENPDVAGTLVGDPGVPVSAFQDFWAKMVTAVDQDPEESAAIGGWDLMNEPFNTHGTWVGTATAAVQAIRATGDDHPIVVEGDQWARDFNGFEPLAHSGQNVYFSAHTYWDDNGSGGYSDKNPPANIHIGVEKIQSFVDWLDKNNAQGFVGEWGVPTNNAAWNPHITTFQNFLKQHNVGSLVWAAGPGWKDDYTLSINPVNDQDRAVMPAIEAYNRSFDI